MSNPPGWNTNPSEWSERIPLVILAMIGFAIAGYLTLYQLDITSSVWEPFFGDGSHKVLNSSISTLLPVPDASLGALGYLADAVTGVIGGRKRWKSMPWIVILFGLAVGPLGLVSVMLVVSQPLVVGAWCTLCLSSAVVSLLMIGPAMDEMLASLQYLRRVHDQGDNVWDVFWGRAEPEEPAPAPAGEPSEPAWGGIIAQLIIVAAGLWIMASPTIFNYDSPASHSNWIVGPILITIGGIAAWEHVRICRWATLPVVIWMAIGPWILGFPTGAIINTLLVAILVLIMTLISGHINGIYGGGWAAIGAGRQRHSTAFANS